MTTWWWVRHGPTHEKAFTGWRDVAADLSDTDRIARLSAALPQGALLVSSDLMRATATADAIGAGRERLLHSADLREFNFGDWDGLRFDQVSARDPDLSRAYWEAPGDVTPPGGESWNDAARRVARFVDRMNTYHEDRHIIAVAHIGVIMTQLQRATAQDARETIAQNIDNLSVTCLVHDAGSWRVELINHIP